MSKLRKDSFNCLGQIFLNNNLFHIRTIEIKKLSFFRINGYFFLTLFIFTNNIIFIRKIIVLDLKLTLIKPIV